MTEYIFDANLLPQIIDKYSGAIAGCTKNNRYFAAEAGVPSPFEKVIGDDVARESSIPILELLEEKREDPHNAENALSIELCISMGYTFVTEDTFLADIAWKYGARVNNLYEFLKAIK